MAHHESDLSSDDGIDLVSLPPLANWTPLCCGTFMLDLGTRDERDKMLLSFWCARCGRSRKFGPVSRKEAETVPTVPPEKCLCDQRYRGIRRRRDRRWEARIWIGDVTRGAPPGTGGSGRGRLVSVGLFGTVEEALAAREKALAELKEALQEASR